MKRYIFTLFFCFLASTLCAQNTVYDEHRHKMQQKWNQYVNANQKKYAEFRDKLNREYADRMSHPWTLCHIHAAQPAPKSPEPPKPVIKTNQNPVTTRALTVSEFVQAVSYEMPNPVEPIARPINESESSYIFSYFSTPCKVHLHKDMAFLLSNMSENTIADAWRRMSSLGYDIIADDCLNYREQLELNDWGYIELAKSLSQSFFGENTSEAVLMQAYILVQSGYKVRLARTDRKLVLMMPFSTNIYEYSYFVLEDEIYYLLDDNKEGGSYYIFNAKFDGEKTASLVIKKEPRFFDEPTAKKVFSLTRYPEISVSVSTNRNLMAFYNSCPVTSDWASYARASLSRKIKRTLYPVLKKQIAGKSEAEAANILLNFVQTAFDYKTDQEQFGYERPLFGDELFYYPYSDCEDRSILFSILVKDLLKLEVVLLHYPGHLATAVLFSDEVPGYYFMVNGKKYVLCDPTYIGAPVGDCMPQFIGTAADVVKIYN